MAVGTIASRALGLVRSLVLAWAIGNKLVGDTFAVANTVPNMIYLLVIGGVINAVFVPQLVRSAKNDADGGKAYTDRLLTLTGAGLAVLTVFALALAPLIIRLTYHNDPSGRSLSLLFAYWCLPQIFFYGIYTVLGQVLNARKVFGPMMWAPIINNVVAIAFTLLLLRTTVDPKVASSVSGGEAALLGVGSTLGVVAQALVLLPYLRSAGYTFTPRFDFRGYGLGRAATLAKWTIGFVLVNQAAYLVIIGLAGSFGKAFPDRSVGVSAYQNAYLFFILPHSVITVSLVTALLPSMSAAAADGRLGEVRSQLSNALRLVGVAIVPCAAGLLLLGSTLGGILFGHGKNDYDDGTYIGILLAVFAAGLVPFAGHHVLLRSFYADEDTKTPFFIACVVSSVNTALALTVTPFLPAEWRTVGLAATYAVTYWVALAVTATLARRRLGGIDERRVLRTYLRLVLAAALGVVAGAAVLLTLRSMIDLHGVGQALLASALAGAVLLVVYLWACARMRVHEVGQLLGSFRR